MTIEELLKLPVGSYIIPTEEHGRWEIWQGESFKVIGKFSEFLIEAQLIGEQNEIVPAIYVQGADTVIITYRTAQYWEARQESK